MQTYIDINIIFMKNELVLRNQFFYTIWHNHVNLNFKVNINGCQNQSMKSMQKLHTLQKRTYSYCTVKARPASYK